MSLGVIVEEPSAELFVRVIAARLNVHIETVNARGRGNLNEKLDDYVDLHPDCEKVIVLVDSHCCPDPSSVQSQFVPSSSNSRVHVCVVVHALESWLLGDSQALARRLRASRIRTPTNPESFCQPEEELERLFQIHGKIYIKRRDPRLIASDLRVNVVSRRCRSFRRFIDLLQDC